MSFDAAGFYETVPACGHAEHGNMKMCRRCARMGLDAAYAAGEAAGRVAQRVATERHVCEQYWNAMGLEDAGIHAVLEFIAPPLALRASWRSAVSGRRRPPSGCPGQQAYGVGTMTSAENEARALAWVEWGLSQMDSQTLIVGPAGRARLVALLTAALLAVVRETGEAFARLFDAAASLYPDKTDSHAVAARLLAAILREHVGDVPAVQEPEAP